MHRFQRYVVITVILTVFPFLSAPANAADPDTEKRIEALEKEIRLLKETIQQLTEEKQAPEDEAAPQPAETPDETDLTQEEVDEIRDRLDETEKKTLMDKINLGAEIRTRYNWFTTEDNDAGITDHNSLPSVRFRLNLYADVSENFKFYGRLTTLKHWGDIDEDPVYFGAKDALIRGDSSLNVERAYGEYVFNNDYVPVYLTAGRLPTTDGLPTNFRENSPRKSTFPGTAFDVESDGVALSLDLQRYVPLPGFYFRSIYSEMVNDYDDEIYRSSLADGIKWYMGQVETRLPGRLESTLIIANYITFPEVPPVEPNTLSDVFGAPVEATFFPSSIGTVRQYTLYTQSERFLGTPIDWFFSYTYADFKADKSATYLMAGEIPLAVGLNSYDPDPEDTSAECIYFGIRLHLPIEMLNEPKLGFEYNHGEKYWWYNNYTPEDPVEKITTNGDVYDFYWIQPIDRYFFIRAGYTQYNLDYIAPLYGDVEDVDLEIRNIYTLINFRF